MEDPQNDLADKNKELKYKLEILKKERSKLKEKCTLLEAKILLKNRAIEKIQTSSKTLKRNARRSSEINLLSKTLSESQINLLLGRRKVIWSDNDLAKAFTLRHMGTKECYLYLKQYLNYPLPALSCVQKWAAVKTRNKDENSP